MPSPPLSPYQRQNVIHSGGRFTTCPRSTGHLRTSATAAFRSALLALAKAAFPWMDGEGIDALVLEKLLQLTWELRILIHVVDDEEMCSLRAARNIHAHLQLQRELNLAACSTTTGSCGSPDNTPPKEAFATTRPAGRRFNECLP
ncbi:unnamed protein product [Lampetra fluviatilis]